MSQKSMNESFPQLMQGSLKECLKHISCFTDILSPDPLIKACLKLVGEEAGKMISAKENTAITYYSSLSQLLDERTQLQDPGDKAILTQVNQDPVRLKKVKELLFVVYPRMIDSYIYHGFSAKVLQLYRTYAQ